MYAATDFDSQITHDRQQDRLAAAAVHRLVPSSPARSRIARTLRRTADRLDAATASTSPVRSALPGGGCERAGSPLRSGLRAASAKTPEGAASGGPSAP